MDTEKKMLELLSIAIAAWKDPFEELPVPVLSAKAKEIEHRMDEVLRYRKQLENLYD